MAGVQTTTVVREGNSRPRPYGGDTLAVRLLEEDGQRPLDVAGWLAEFIGRARRSLDIAVYDCRLSEGPAGLLRKMIAGRIAAGVRVRLVYDAGKKPRTFEDLDQRGVEPAPEISIEHLAELGLRHRAARPIVGRNALMHHKYVVRDGEAVWTGSLNLTDDAMGRSENMTAIVDAPALARQFTRDFVQLWGTGKIVSSGARPIEPVILHYGGMPALAGVEFSPTHGDAISAGVAGRVLAARQRVALCSTLISSSRLLRALVRLIDRGEVLIEGVYDETLMAGLVHVWEQRPEQAWKAAAFRQVVGTGRFVGKAPGSLPIDLVQNRLGISALVVDDTVLTGSYGFSHVAGANADHLLIVESPSLADRLVAFARQLQDWYRHTSTSDAQRADAGHGRRGPTSLEQFDRLPVERDRRARPYGSRTASPAPS